MIVTINILWLLVPIFLFLICIYFLFFKVVEETTLKHIPICHTRNPTQTLQELKYIHLSWVKKEYVLGKPTVVLRINNADIKLHSHFQDPDNLFYDY